MSPAGHEPRTNRIELSRPRALTAQERALLDFLLAGPVGREELREQAATAEVVATCSCGCSSVWLRVDPGARPARFVEGRTPAGGGEWVPITAVQRTTRGKAEVTLHVVEGRLEELEIWAGAYGVRPRIELGKLEREPAPPV